MNGATGSGAHAHAAPSDCPVCGERLRTTRLGCEACGTELSGRFAGCAYCSLSAYDQKILRVFLSSRGNMRELAKELGVSYPTARQRFAELLIRLGLDGQTEDSDGGPPPVDREGVLRQLAAGQIDLDEAAALLK